MPPLDLLQGFGELCIVCAELDGPFLSVVGGSVVSPRGGGAFDLPAVPVGVLVGALGQRAVLALLDARILCAFRGQCIRLLGRS